MTSILVAVDGTDGSLEAARWAAAMAARMGASLHLVHAMTGVDEAVLNATASRHEDTGAYPRGPGHAVLDQAADEVHADFPELRVSRTLRSRGLADVLADTSRRALLVVLTRSWWY